MNVSKKDRLQIEIELLDWLFERTDTPVMIEHYFYAFATGVLIEKKKKLKECDRK